MTTFRTSIERISPPWLKKYLGYAPRFMYTPALIIDGLLDGLTQGLKAKMPGIGTPTAFTYIGRDRGIVRGPSESEAGYAARAVAWLDTWRIAGSPFAIMDALAGYISPDTMVMRVVDNTGNWYTRAADGTRSFYRASPNNWDWDSEPTKWFRYWVIMYPDGVWEQPKAWGDPDLWTTGLWGEPGEVWGVEGLSGANITDMRKLIRKWGPAGPYCVNLILAFDNAMFDPTSAPGAPMPSGNWDDPSNRDTDASYFEGSIF